MTTASRSSLRPREIATAVLVVALSCALRPTAAVAQQQEVFVPSNATWAAFDELGTPLGNAQLVCLRTSDIAYTCPAGAVSWNYPGIASQAWYQDLSVIPNGRFIWAPGIGPGDIIFDAFYVFRKTITLNAPPQSGNFFITADDYAEVRVNGSLVGSIGATTGVGGPRPLRSFNILPFLRQGANDIEVKAKNGLFPDFPCSNCATYGTNPAGVVFGGRITAGSGAPPVPGAPTNLQARTNGNLLELTWGVPASGGAPTGYSLLARGSVGGPVLLTLPLGDVLRFDATAPSGTFVLTVRATGASGLGPESAPVTVTLPQPPVAPGAPTNLAATGFGAGVTLQWSAPSSGGLPSQYVLAVQIPGGQTVGVPLPASPTAVGFSGVPPGTYRARVSAANAGGTSAPSNEAVFTIAAPSAPGAPVLGTPVFNASSRQLQLTWTPGSGGAATSYALIAALSPGGVPVTSIPLGNGTSATLGVPGGIAGTFYLRLVASNAVGASPLSNEVSVVIP